MHKNYRIVMEGTGHKAGESEKLLAECEEFFQLCSSPPQDLNVLVQQARDFISRHSASQRPIALVTVRMYTHSSYNLMSWSP